MEQRGVLRIQTRQHKDRVEIIVSDTGYGIPADRMEKIFNYYYTTKKDGSGLGLPIAHRIIEAHGGQLKLESKLGEGTKATITLPIQT
jgi:signal transduction histidine kinase